MDINISFILSLRPEISNVGAYDCQHKGKEEPQFYTIIMPIGR